MQLVMQSFIDNMLSEARYEYDPATCAWCAWVEALQGAYAQADTVEEVRNQLAEVIEDYVLVSLYERQQVPAFAPFMKMKNAGYAQAN